MNVVKIYSKHGCKFCDLAKTFLKDLDINFQEIRLDKEENPIEYEKQREKLVYETKQITFPWIFANDTFIGGYKDLVDSYISGKLAKVLGIDFDEIEF